MALGLTFKSSLYRMEGVLLIRFKTRLLESVEVRKRTAKNIEKYDAHYKQEKEQQKIYKIMIRFTIKQEKQQQIIKL